MAQRTPPDSAVEYPTEEWDRLFAELASVESEIERLTQEFGDVAGSVSFLKFYKVSEVATDFVRLQAEEEERIIPFQSVQEIRRTVAKQ